MTRLMITGLEQTQNRGSCKKACAYGKQKEIAGQNRSYKKLENKNKDDRDTAFNLWDCGNDSICNKTDRGGDGITGITGNAETDQAGRKSYQKACDRYL